MRRFIYKKIEFRIERHPSMHGHYYLYAHYKGEDIKRLITESDVWDWCDDDSNIEKHLYAKRRAYEIIRNTYYYGVN